MQTAANGLAKVKKSAQPVNEAREMCWPWQEVREAIKLSEEQACRNGFAGFIGSL